MTHQLLLLLLLLHLVHLLVSTAQWSGKKELQKLVRHTNYGLVHQRIVKINATQSGLNSYEGTQRNEGTPCVIRLSAYP